MAAMTPAPHPEGRDRVLQRVLVHQERLWAYLFALSRSATQADDLLQQTLLVVCAKWQDALADGDLLPWAMRIAKLEYLNLRNGRDQRLVLLESELLEQLLLADPDPESDQRREREIRALQSCLSALDARGRDAVLLRYHESLSGEEASRRLGMSVGAYYTLLTRVRQALRECVERRLGSGNAP